MKIFGHRGARGHAPENTLGSIALAMDMGADWIEIDVQRCATGEAVVIHDETVDRTTNGQGRVDQLTLDQLQTLDAGDGERLPTLQAVLDLCHGRAGLNVEIKSAAATDTTVAVLRDALHAGWSTADLLVSSFDHTALQSVHQRLPAVPLGALLYGVPHDLAACVAALHASALHVSVEHLHPALLADARQRGVAVHCYTVNHPDQIGGVQLDGIFTDFPDRFVRQT